MKAISKKLLSTINNELKIEDPFLSSVSLYNSEILMKHLGKPSIIVLTEENNECNTVAYWGFKKHKHLFKGFSWGYFGDGSKYLHKFLSNLGVKVGIDFIVNIHNKNLPFVFEI